MRRYEDWLKQAKRDIEAAEQSMKSEFFEWACFQAHQSAEKALKSLLRFINLDSWGHGLVHFLQDWKDEIKDKKKFSFDKNRYNDLLEKCQTLDTHYIQARYPNGFSSGFPAEYYNQTKAKRSISYAKSIISYVEEKIKTLSSSE